MPFRVPQVLLWSGVVPLDYGFYVVGRPGNDVPQGSVAAPVTGDEAGLYVVTPPDLLEVHLEVLLELDPPPRGLSTVTLRSDPEEQAGVTTWEGGETIPAAYGVVGPGTWQVWFERGDLGEDQRAADAEGDVLHFHPLDEVARAWGENAEVEIEARAAAAGEAEDAGYTEFVKAAPGTYVVVWDEELFADSRPAVDVTAELVDDTTVVELPGAAAFLHRPLAQWTVERCTGDFKRSPLQAEKLIKHLQQPGVVRILDADLRPVPGVPDPAAVTPCYLRISKAIRDHPGWTLHRLPDEDAAARAGAYDWWIEFGPRP